MGQGVGGWELVAGSPRLDAVVARSAAFRVWLRLQPRKIHAVESAVLRRGRGILPGGFSRKMQLELLKPMTLHLQPFPFSLDRAPVRRNPPSTLSPQRDPDEADPLAQGEGAARERFRVPQEIIKRQGVFGVRAVVAVSYTHLTLPTKA